MAAPAVEIAARGDGDGAHRLCHRGRDCALGDHIEDRLEEAGFFFPPDKAEGMKTNLRKIWGRCR
jgi:hypothetical protein